MMWLIYSIMFGAVNTPVFEEPERMSYVDEWEGDGYEDTFEEDWWYEEDPIVFIDQFVDFECPACKNFHEKVYPQLKENYIDTGKVVINDYNYPLSSIHAHAMDAAEFYECASNQIGYSDKLKDFTYGIDWDKGIDFEKAEADLSTEYWNLEGDAVEQCMESDETVSWIENDMDYGSSMRIIGTPSFVLSHSYDYEGVLYTGSNDYASLSAEIDRLLEEAAEIGEAYGYNEQYEELEEV